MRSGSKTFLLIIFIFAILTLLLSPLIGSSPVNFLEAFKDPSSVSARILMSIRMPRIAFAFLVGAGLSIVGAVFQALLRNDLATPYTLGVSSGGAFGAVVAIKSGIIFNIFIFSSVGLFSIAGSLLSILIIYLIASGDRELSTYTLILAGVTISLFFSAFTLFIHYIADFTETYRMVHWLMGALDVTDWNYPLAILIVLTIVFGYAYVNRRAFNLILAGNELALSKGVQVDRLQKWSFFLASILVGIIVSIAGPIGFVGLIIPHVLRLLTGPDHRTLFPGTILLGGSFLVWCDTLARTIIAPAELPVGIITSILGGPFFIYLLIRKKSERV
ncbi:MAG: FecCD family ABC transporter permease [Calditrichaceae bacterium]